MKRLCIYAKDVSIITGRGQRYAQRLLQSIKISLKKDKHQFVTIQEFADYTGIDLKLIHALCK